MKRPFLAVLLAVVFLVSCEQNSLVENSTTDSLLSFLGLKSPVPDIQAPVITLFAGNGPNPTITALIPFDLTATDNVGINGWRITETPTPPLPTAPGWQFFQPTSYTITSGTGTYELYVWARDFGGNVSAVSVDSHFPIVYNPPGDGTPPVVSDFHHTTTNPTNDPLIPVFILAADDVGITEYIITESAVTPLLTDPGWGGTLPATHLITGGYGTYDLYLWARDLAGNISAVNANSNFSITYADLTSPTVTINQAGGQADPTNTLPITFDVVFSEAINPATFTAGDINQGGTAGAVTWNLSTSDNINWTLTATAVAGSGTVVPSIPASMVQDMSGNSNMASASTDNSVTYDVTSPTVTIEQDVGQPDPTNTLPVTFNVVFSKVINPATFGAGDITQGGTAGAVTWNLSTSDNINWTLEAMTVAGTGTIVPSIPASMVQDMLGNGNTASTSSDNIVAYDATPPTVTINQAGGQADPTNALPLTFNVVFSKAINPATFTGADITQGGSATGVTWNLSTGDNIIWTLQASAVSGAGTVIPSIPASMVQDNFGNGNTASTSTDNSVLYDNVAPVVFQFLNAGPNPTTDQVVPLTIGVTDPVGTVTGWMITQSATAPLAGDPGWLGAQPTSYLLKAIPAVYVLYLWAKDSVGNVSSGLSLTVEYQLPAYPMRVLQTGQADCYDSAGTLLGSCAGTGQDGDYRYGLVWDPSTRYTLGVLTVTDNTTGLVWVGDASLSGSVTWDNAFAYVTSLNSTIYGGRSDWRLPNISELMSLTNYGTSNIVTWMLSKGFTITSNLYWSSTTYSNHGYAFTYNFSSGQKDILSKTIAAGYVWAVAGTTTILPKTGQALCYDSSGALLGSCAGTGQDGEYQYGLAWPSPRFTDHGDNTITDNLTGLMWTEDANLMATTHPAFDVEGTAGDGRVTWQTALDFVNQLNLEVYAGYSDWRLPNANELLSLHSPGDGSGFLTASGFTNGSVQNHWESTTFEETPVNSFRFNAPYGSQSVQDKDTVFLYVWPVRGGN